MFPAFHIYPQLAQPLSVPSLLQFIVTHMLRLILSVILVLIGVQPAAAEQCQESACINVYTQNNQIIIEAHKGNATTKTTIAQAPKKVPVKSVPKPRVVPLFFPPKATAPAVFKVTVSKKPVIKPTYKPVVKKVATRANLSDRLTKMVPTAGVAYQPEFEPLVNVPVYFWCDLPTLFQSRVEIIGEVVDVALRPSFVWSFGDGGVYATTENGGAYPNGKIHHTYVHAGTYQISLLTTWNGTYTHNAAVRAVTGTVKKLSIAYVTIVKAPTTFKG